VSVVAGEDVFPGVGATLTGAVISARYFDAGPCGGGTRLGDGTIDNDVKGTILDCSGNVVGNSVGLTSVLIVFNLCAGGTCNMTSTNTGFASTPGCSNPLWEAGRPITVTVNHPGQVNPYTGTGTLTQSSIDVDNPLTPSTIDLRTSAMIDAGCGACENPSGSTVTVTDSAGLSYTHVF
jgi:hypothetical protein